MIEINQSLVARLALRFSGVSAIVINAYGWAIVGLFASVGSFWVPKIPATFLCFYFFVCWLFWIACLFADLPKNRIFILAILWSLINCAIFSSFVSAIRVLGDVANSQGSEMVWGVAYLPTILPFGLFLGLASDSVNSFLKFFEIYLVQVFGPAYGHLIVTWAAFSIISMLQCTALSSIVLLLPKIFPEWRCDADVSRRSN